MKAVLMSIQPYWVFLIIARKMGWDIDKEKTIEVRKNFPKDQDWNRNVEIYCSKDKKSFSQIPKKYQPLMEKFLGKVIGEFVCDDIDTVHVFNDILYCVKNSQANKLGQMCLTIEEVKAYLGDKHGYNLHISYLKIYDKPKELSEFYVEGDCDCMNCKKCYWFDSGNGYNVEDGCNLAYKGIALHKSFKPITRPPQSYMFVEELQNG
jgi:predicted transcriptional regulator